MDVSKRLKKRHAMYTLCIHKINSFRLFQFILIFNVFFNLYLYYTLQFFTVQFKYGLKINTNLKKNIN